MFMNKFVAYQNWPLYAYFMQQPTQPAPGPYTIPAYDLERQPHTVTHDDGSVASHKSWDIKDTLGRKIAEVNFSTCLYSASVEEVGKPMHCNNLAEAEATAHLIRASWLMREALKQAREALAMCYNVLEYPANGNTQQDKAIRSIDAALLAADGTVQP